MMKDNVVTFINKGYIVNKKMVLKNMMGLCIFSLFTILIFLMDSQYTSLVIYLCFFLIFLIFTINLCSNKKWNFSNGFLAHAIELIFALITFNFIVYYGSKYLNSYSNILFYGILILQILFSPIFLFCRYKIIQSKKNVKKYSPIPYVSSGIGYAFVFFLKYNIEVPEENQGVVLNIIFYISIIVLAYYINIMILKWFLSRKFEINEYRRITLYE